MPCTSMGWFGSSQLCLLAIFRPGPESCGLISDSVSLVIAHAEQPGCAICKLADKTLTRRVVACTLQLAST